MPEVLSLHEAAGALAKATGKRVVFLTYASDDVLSAVEAAPILKQNLQAWGDGYAFVICESESEMQEVFWSTVGDDGPTQLNPYNGPVRVYALTFGPDGEARNENT